MPEYDVRKSFLVDATAPSIAESLAAAEKEFADLRSRGAQLSSVGEEGDHPEIWDRVFALETWIATTAPATLADAAIKLRRLADPVIGVDAGESADGSDGVSVRQVLAFIEAQLAITSTP
jgi:hypothetical protein